VKINEITLPSEWLGKKAKGAVATAGNGIKGAVAGFQASQAQRAADPDAAVRNRIRQQNFKQELTQWQNNLNMVAKQGANVKDPATFLKVLQSYVEVHYPNARVSMDINQVAPTNPKSISDYLFAAYNSEMDGATTTATVAPAGPSEFLKKFKVTDSDPTHPTVAYGSTEFQRDDAGTWIDFRTGKLAPPRFVRVLDKVSPPAKASATPTHGGVTAIAVTDNAGVVWTKDEDNNRWLNDAGTVATPDNATKLEKLAVTQYQARQMGA
jgi:hypothetical protein